MLTIPPPSNLRTRITPTLLERPVASLIPQDGSGASDRAGARAKAGAGLTGAAGPAKAGTSDGGTSPEASVQNTRKTIVDQRTTDAGSMRITVVAYSDGSSETLREIKNTDDLSRAIPQRERPASLSDKGMIVDMLG
ncbi:hypothetical protein ASE75_01810 [Sphingomonas sp. Leaf17]|uniref:hypothetical protein n=1 Tax=Sphingomonas sp. Leaf17 TaxID=1735683 RepID=UPI0006F86660|nr:hypothetical protein [Sphingomonas sp. Leaf17]KQM67688.1 hypothetical protein ASE75_01810 [Sphingomonas sp. Leaf17]